MASIGRAKRSGSWRRIRRFHAKARLALAPSLPVRRGQPVRSLHPGCASPPLGECRVARGHGAARRPALAPGHLPPASAPRALAAQCELCDRSLAGPRETDDRRTPRPRVAQPGRSAPGHLPVPPLLERVPQQPADGDARGGVTRLGPQGARPARARVHAREIGALVGGERERPHAQPALHPARRQQPGRPDGDGSEDAQAGGPGRDRALCHRVDVAHPLRHRGPRRLGARLPLHRAVVSQDRRVLEGPSPGQPPSSSPTTATTTWP
jgi:hypothetical protein